MGHILVDRHSVRPGQESVYTLGKREDEEMADEKKDDKDEPKRAERGNEGEQGEEKEEESISIRGTKLVRQPAREEYDEHVRSLMPFRKWCPLCVRGRRRISIMQALPKVPGKYQ